MSRLELMRILQRRRDRAAGKANDLRASEVIAIRKRLGRGEPPEQLAELYCVPLKRILCISRSAGSTTKRGPPLHVWVREARERRATLDKRQRAAVRRMVDL